MADGVYGKMRARLLASSLATVLLVTVTPAWAGPAEVCIDVANEAELLKKDVTRLTLARDKLRGCAVAECPAAIRDDCRQSLAELDDKIPSVVLVAEDESGHPLLDATVKMDGAPLAAQLDGKPTTVDAGVRAFLFERPGAAPVTVRVVLIVGQKNVQVLARFGGAPRPAPAAVREALPAPDPGDPAASFVTEPSPSASPVRWVGVGTAAVGVVGLGLGAFFGLRASSKQSDANCPDNRCKDEASASTLRDAKSAGTASTIFFVGGALLAAGGVTMFLLAPKPAMPSARLGPAIGPGVAGVSLHGLFF